MLRKSSTLVLVFTLLAGLSTQASADNWYVGGLVGGSVPTATSNSDELETQSDLTPTGSLVVGYRFENVSGTGVSISPEFSFDVHGYGVHGLNTDGNDNHASGNLYTVSNHASVWVGYEVMPSVELYAGGGVGVTVLKAAGIRSENLNAEIDETVTAFSFKTGLGVVYRINPEWAVNAGYRFTGVPSYSVGDAEASLYSHDFLIGIQYHF